MKILSLLIISFSFSFLENTCFGAESSERSDNILHQSDKLKRLKTLMDKRASAIDERNILSEKLRELKGNRTRKECSEDKDCIEKGEALDAKNRDVARYEDRLLKRESIIASLEDLGNDAKTKEILEGLKECIRYLKSESNNSASSPNYSRTNADRGELRQDVRQNPSYM